MANPEHVALVRTGDKKRIKAFLAEGCTLNLRGADLCGVHLVDFNFGSAEVDGARFDGSTLVDCILGEDMIGVSFVGCHLINPRGALHGDTRIFGCNFTGARITSDLPGPGLSTDFPDCTGESKDWELYCRTEGYDLSTTFFYGCNFTGVSFDTDPKGWGPEVAGSATFKAGFYGCNFTGVWYTWEDELSECSFDDECINAPDYKTNSREEI